MNSIPSDVSSQDIRTNQHDTEVYFNFGAKQGEHIFIECIELGFTIEDIFPQTLMTFKENSLLLDTDR